MTTKTKAAGALAPADEDYHAETWAYAGVRVADDGKATHAWADPERPGVTRLWSDRRAYRVGAFYTMTIARVTEPAEGDGEPAVRLWRRGDPVPAGATIEDEDQQAAWEAASEAAQRRLRRESYERRAKRDGGAIDQAAEAVCRLAAGAKSYDELDLLITSVRRRMLDAWGRPR